jgi:hypothetical protein
MCGIAGVIVASQNGFSNDELGILHGNMFANQLRGWDSTGMFGVSKDNEVQWMKTVGDYSEFRDSKLWKNKEDGLKNFLWNKGRIAIGHGRAATVGKITADNAHPFEVSRDDGSKIILVHNGTLDGRQTLPNFYDFSVDSNWIADCIVKHGAEEALSQINGAMALVWYDTKDRTLNMYRNDQRPLHFIITRKNFDQESADMIVINSVPEPLRWLFDKNKLFFVPPDNSVLYFVPNEHYIISLDDPMKFQRVKKIQRKIVSIKPYVNPHANEIASFRRRLELLEWPVNQRVNLDFLKHFTEADRTFELDCLRVILGVYKKIEFLPVTNKTMYTKANGLVVMRDGEPYLPDLREITSRVEGVACCEYRTPLNVLTYSYDRTEDLIKTIKSEFKERLNNKENAANDDLHSKYVDIGIKRFKAKRMITWHSKDKQNFIIRNNAVVKTIEPTFERYSNEEDGLFVVGDEMIFEVDRINVINIVKDSHKLVRLCYGSPILANTTVKAVECFFYDVSSDSDETIKNTIFKGKIQQIKLSTENQYEKSSKQILISLSNVKTYVEDIQQNHAS